MVRKMGLSKDEIETTRQLHYSGGVKFPVHRERLTYQCERCGAQWYRFSDDKNENGRCKLAKCQGSVITKLIRLLKGEEIYSYGKVIKRESVEWWY
jgi:hypothetical protein